jgi:hypothetical protein
MSEETPVIRGQATIDWRDQARYLVRPYAKALAMYAAIMVLVFGAIWVFTLSDTGWIATRSEPLGALFLFIADVWPFYLGTFVVLALVMAGHGAVVFYRYPQVNRQLSFEVTAAELRTRDASDVVLAVPWTSVVRTRNTRHALYLQIVTRAWRYVPWRAFAPEDRDQILRWATRQRDG